MKVRKAEKGDLDTALQIYARAREFMKENGNPNQWGDAYPPKELVAEDIEAGALCLLCEESDGRETVHAVFAFFPDGDPIYDHIDGEWLNTLPHAAIHRVASAGKSRGVLCLCVDYCLSFSDNLKIDTSPDNTVMRAALKKLGFKECGHISSLIALQLCKKQT